VDDICCCQRDGTHTLLYPALRADALNSGDGRTGCMYASEHICHLLRGFATPRDGCAVRGAHTFGNLLQRRGAWIWAAAFFCVAGCCASSLSAHLWRGHNATFSS